MILQKYALVKDPFKVQDRSMDFSVNEYKKVSLYGIWFYTATMLYKITISQTLVWYQRINTIILKDN